MTIFVAVFAPLTVALGFWQIDRGAQKRVIEDARIASFGALPIDESRMSQAASYARVRVEGRYDGQHQFLVDNHARHGVPGYVVITPFDSAGGRRLLVNRGWVEAPSSRSELPSVPVTDADVRIVGSLWIASATDKDASVWDDHWPKRVEQFDAARIGDLVKATQRVEFRLEEDQPGSLEPIILGEEMSSTRHVGYAVQWFAMAIALIVVYVLFGIRRGREV